MPQLTKNSAFNFSQYSSPILYPKQEIAIFHQRRYGFIEASTKTGKTTGCIVWLLEQALQGSAGNNYWWVAPIFAQAKIAYRRLKRYLPDGFYTSNETEMTITLKSCGSIIWFKGADKPDSLYGEDVYAAVIDEASRVKDEAFNAVRSTLTFTKGPIRCIGNVKGRKNWFYKYCRRAEGGAENMEYHKLIAYDAVEAGVLSAEEVADAKALLPEAVFKELYLAEPSDDQGNPFGFAAIKKCIKPMSLLVPDAWGWDLAKKLDFTVGIGLDAFGSTCRFERFQKPWPDTILTIRNETQDVPAYYDSTGVGDPVGEIITLDSSMNFEGYMFTSKSKQQLMEGLAIAIQQGKVSYPEGQIVSELEQFEYEYTRTGVKYSAPEGYHDDCVCSLALAVRRQSVPYVGMGLHQFYGEEAKREKERQQEAAKNPYQQIL